MTARFGARRPGQWIAPPGPSAAVRSVVRGPHRLPVTGGERRWTRRRSTGRRMRCISAGQGHVPRVKKRGLQNRRLSLRWFEPITRHITCHTSGNGPLAGNSRLCGPFCVVPSCVTAGRCRPACCGGPRTHSGPYPGGGSGVRNRRFPRTATDWSARARSGLTFAGESGVHPCVPARARSGLPRGGRPGRGGGLMGGMAVWESVTLAGRAERARVARAFVGGVLGPGHPCGDVAVLLASELFSNSEPDPL
jgi:hypothetical protein